MAFVSPWYLLGLLAAGIPVAIHLIRRQRTERIVLPTARFVAAAPKKLVYFQRIQQWLLLAIRVAIVGLLAAAFARPIITGAYTQMAGGQPKSTIIVLDTSMSMQYGDRFSRAKAAAVDIIRSLKPGDEAGAVVFAESPGRLRPLTTELGALEVFVRSLPAPGFRSTNFSSALRLAEQLLQAARYQEKTVHLISDFQKSAVPAEIEAWKLHPGIGLNLVRVGTAATFNLAVVEGSLVRRRDAYTVVGRIRNAGTVPVDTARVSLAVDGTSPASRTIDLEGRSEIRVEFPFTLQRTGVHRGTLKITGDRFEPDNIYYFVVDVAPVISVLCVAGETAGRGKEDESYWFRSALSHKDKAVFQVDAIEPERLTIDKLAAYAVVALLNVGSLSPEQAGALRAFVKGGGGLLLAPADRVDGDATNRLFRDVMPARLLRKKAVEDGTALVVDPTDRNHPVVRALQVGEKIDFGTARFYRYWAVEPASGSEVLVRFEPGDPALIAGRVGSGRVLLFTSSLDPRWNNFPRQVTYLPLLHEAVRHLADRRDARMSYRVGDPVAVDVPPGGAASVISPKGEVTLLRSSATGFAYYQATAEPGFYRIRSGSRPSDFAVNAAARESELISVSPDDIRDRLTSPETPDADARDEPSSVFKTQLEDTRRLWWWVLLLVAALSLGETLLANRTYR